MQAAPPQNDNQVRGRDGPQRGRWECCRSPLLIAFNTYIATNTRRDKIYLKNLEQPRSRLETSGSRASLVWRNTNLTRVQSFLEISTGVKGGMNFLEMWVSPFKKKSKILQIFKMKCVINWMRHARLVATLKAP